MDQPYNPEKAQEITLEALNEDQTPEEQIRAILELDPEQRRLLFIGIFSGDV